MRVYVPATLHGRLRGLLASGALPAPLEAFAVTPELREWYVDDDAEALEFAALTRPLALHCASSQPTLARRRGGSCSQSTSTTGT